MHHPVFQLCKFSAVPACSGTDKVSGDTLELVYLGALAVRTFFKVLVGILESTVHAAVAVVVD